MSELKDANTNPWYVLMTLFGEQTGEQVDWELHEKNRVAWEYWASQRGVIEMKNEGCPQILLDIDPTFHLFWNFWSFVDKAFRKRLPHRILPDDGAREVDLAWLTFPNRLDLSGFRLPSVSFVGSKFSRSGNLDNARFDGSAHFDEAIFQMRLGLSHCEFDQGLSMTGAEFYGRVDMSKTKAKRMLCDRCTFHGPLVARSLAVGGDFSVENSEFHMPSTFEGMSVVGTLNGREATFCSIASFSRVTFDDDVSFTKAEFIEKAKFDRAIFNETSIFYDIRFRGDVSFYRCSFHGFSTFAKTVFRAVAPEPQNLDFRNARFSAPANFDSAKFTSAYPRLAGTVFESEVTFSATDDHWPSRQPLKELFKTRGAALAETRDSLAKLRHAMSRNGLPEEEHFFFRREMDAQSQQGGFWSQLPTLLFGIVSDYGHSIRNPAIFLFWLWWGPVGAYGAAFGPSVRSPCDIVLAFPDIVFALGKGAAFSGSNILKFLGLQRRYFDGVFDTLPSSLLAVSALQTIFGFVFLFFLGLGLRQRFRLK